MNTQHITLSQLYQQQAGAKTLEQDGRGIKVSLLPSGRILKVFRIRGILSSARLFSHAKRFVRNARRLSQKGILTVQATAMYDIIDTSMSAVEYAPIEGETVRKLLKQTAVSDTMLAQLGQFIAQLHQKGIYFRSLHLGNIVYTSNSQFGLIDVADMRIYAWPLHFFTRLRNFDRIKQYDEDMQHLDVHQRHVLMQSYIQISGYQGRRMVLLCRYL